MSIPVSQWCPESTPEATQDRGQLIACFKGQWEHLGLRPLLISGIIRDILKHHFARVDSIEAPVLKTADWRNALSTGILIETITRWRGDLVEKRPAVIIKRNAFRNVRIVRDDLQGVDEHGDPNYITLWVGSHTIFCIHKTGASTEILANEVQRLLTGFGPEIRDTFDFKKFQATEVGTLAEIEEATESFVVPVTLGWAYEEKWKLRRQTHRLTAVEFIVDF